MAKATAAKKSRPSFAPSTYKQSTGLWDDVDVTIEDITFTGDEAPDNYKGGDNGIPLFCKVTLQLDGVEGQNTEWFSLGGKSRENFEVDEDGKTLTPLFEGAQIEANSNIGLFVASAVAAGFPESDLDVDGYALTAMEGKRYHINRVPDTRNIAGRKESKYPPTVLAITRVYDEEEAAPVKGKAGKPAAKTTAAASKPAVAAKGPKGGDADLDSQAAELLMSILGDNDGSIKRTALLSEVTKRAMKDPNRDKLRQLVYSADFLSQEGMGWSFDGKQEVSLAE